MDPWTGLDRTGKDREMRRLAFLLCVSVCPLLTAGDEDHAEAEGKQQPDHLTPLLHKLLQTAPNEYAVTMTDKNDPDRQRRGMQRPTGKSAGLKEPNPTPAPAARKPPSPKPTKPWWDWLGVTDKKKPPPPPSPIARANRAAPPSARPTKPWWDLLGVTSRNKLPRPPSPKAPAIRSAPPNKATKPWWDWLGVTDKKKPQPKK